MRCVTVNASAGNLCVQNAGTCAERRLIRRIKLIAARKGVCRQALSAWFSRTFGRVQVTRFLADGTAACCLPCVCCAKAMDRLQVKWEATLPTGERCRSTDPTLPRPQPTRSMMAHFKWR